MNPMVAIYVDLVKKGKKEFPNDIPENLRSDVEKALEDDGCSIGSSDRF